MLLEYEAALHDIAEVHIRLFLRSSTFKKQRVYFALGSAISLLALLFVDLVNAMPNGRCKGRSFVELYGDGTAGTLIFNQVTGTARYRCTHPTDVAR